MKSIKIIFTVCFLIFSNTDICSQSDLNTIINNHGLLDKKSKRSDQLKLSSEFKGYLIDRNLDSIASDIDFLENYFDNEKRNIPEFFNIISNFLMKHNDFYKSCFFIEKAVSHVIYKENIFDINQSILHLGILRKYTDDCPKIHKIYIIDSIYKLQIKIAHHLKDTSAIAFRYSSYALHLKSNNSFILGLEMLDSSEKYRKSIADVLHRKYLKFLNGRLSGDFYVQIGDDFLAYQLYNESLDLLEEINKNRQNLINQNFPKFDYFETKRSIVQLFLRLHQKKRAIDVLNDILVNTDTNLLHIGQLATLYNDLGDIYSSSVEHLDTINLALNYYNISLSYRKKMIIQI